MIRTYVVEKERLRPVEFETHREAAVWVDLLHPTAEEEHRIEEWIGVGIPTREEMEEIEVSSRLYMEDGAYFLTATLLAHTDDDHPQTASVTFVLAGPRLITVRYIEPRAFTTFPKRAEKVAVGCTTGESVLIGLLEAVVDRLADVLERISRDVDTLSTEVFRSAEPQPKKQKTDFQLVLQQIGRKEDLTSKIRYSLMTLQRIGVYLANTVTPQETKGDGHVKALAGDVNSLIDHAAFISQKITFLLDATLGMINNEQNAIIKIVSVAAVVFLPPTLVASVYGMNFKYMPELEWLLGYPMALVLMVLSAVLPFWFFKRKGWL